MHPLISLPSPTASHAILFCTMKDSWVLPGQLARRVRKFERVPQVTTIDSTRWPWQIFVHWQSINWQYPFSVNLCKFLETGWFYCCVQAIAPVTFGNPTRAWKPLTITEKLTCCLVIELNEAVSFTEINFKVTSQLYLVVRMLMWFHQLCWLAWMHATVHLIVMAFSERPFIWSEALLNLSTMQHHAQDNLDKSLYAWKHLYTHFRHRTVCTHSWLSSFCFCPTDRSHFFIHLRISSQKSQIYLSPPNSLYETGETKQK